MLVDDLRRRVAGSQGQQHHIGVGADHDPVQAHATGQMQHYRMPAGAVKGQLSVLELTARANTSDFLILHDFSGRAR
ncbi:hypothetical protein GCM10009078_21310 [Cupriavidus gilardii]